MDLPTTTSRLPVSNHRPAEIFSAGRISMPMGERPRRVTLAPSGASTLARLITVTTSSDAMGSPFCARAMPVLNFQTWDCPRGKVGAHFRLGAFAHNNDLQRIAAGGERSAQPGQQRHHGQQNGHGERDAQRGHQRGGLANHQITKVIRERDGHGRISIGRAQRLHDIGAGSVPRRDERTEEADAQGHQDASRRYGRVEPLDRREEYAGGAFLDAADQESREQESYGSARDGDGAGFAEDDEQDIPASETQGLEHADFAHALAHRHGHGVAGNQQDGEHHRGADANQKQLHVAEHADEGEQEGLLGLGAGLHGSVVEFVVDGFRHAGDHTRVVAQNVKGSHLALAALRQAFPHVGPIEVEHLAFAWTVEDAAHGEFERAGIDVADQGDAIAQVEVELVGEIVADDGAGAVANEGLLLVFGYFQLAKYGEELLRLDAEAGEEVLGIAGVLIRAVEPLRGHEFLYAGHLADALAVKQRDGDG